VDASDGERNDIKRAVGQTEVCPTTGSQHLQGYVQFRNAVRHATLRKLFTGANIRKAKGSPASNYTYCTKEETRQDAAASPFVFGSFPKRTQGRRTDIHEFVQELESDGINAAIESNPSILVRYPRGVQAYSQHVLRQRFSNLPTYRHVSVRVHQGDAGQGKTRAVYERAHVHYGEMPYALFSMSPEWWDGYQGENVILLDDFYGQLPLNRLLRILDGYPILLPVKGSYTFSLYTEVHITTNQDWDQWYQIIRERDQYERGSGQRLYEALKRRITSVTHYRSL
jgi:hypothetical protein